MKPTMKWIVAGAAVAGAMLLSRKASASPVTPPMKGSPSPPMSFVPGPGAGGVYRTQPDDIVIDPSGWFTLSNGTQITRLPPLDSKTDLFARLGPSDWRVYAASVGARLPTLAEYDLLHAEGLHIDPVTLPTQAMVYAAFPGIKQSDIPNAAQQMRNSSMSSMVWARLHDDEVRRRLLDAHWGATMLPVDNAGKHWAEPDAQTPEGNGLLYGWWKQAAPNKDMIQTPFRGHMGDQIDYGSTAHLVRM